MLVLRDTRPGSQEPQVRSAVHGARCTALLGPSSRAALISSSTRSSVNIGGHPPPGDVALLALGTDGEIHVPRKQ